MGTYAARFNVNNSSGKNANSFNGVLRRRQEMSFPLLYDSLRGGSEAQCMTITAIGSHLKYQL